MSDAFILVRVSEHQVADARNLLHKNINDMADIVFYEDGRQAWVYDRFHSRATEKATYLELGVKLASHIESARRKVRAHE